MGVHDGAQFRTDPVNPEMERQLGRGLVASHNGPIGTHRDDVLAPQRALVHAGGRDPDRAVLIADG